MAVQAIIPILILVLVTLIVSVSGSFSLPLSLEHVDFSSNFYDFIPHMVAYMKHERHHYSFSGRCFKNSKVAFSIDHVSRVADIHLQTDNAASLFCTDNLLLLTQNSLNIKTIYTKGSHKWRIHLDDILYADVVNNGFYLLTFMTALSTLWKTSTRPSNFFLENPQPRKTSSS
ncbi:hypothetical protein GEMRC1_004115 [Eukaryota sp. GEM-RC1]